MATQTFTIHTENPEQTNALKAFVKALKMKFEVKTEKKPLVSKEKQEVLDGLKQAVKEINLIKQGKMTARNVQDFLDEL